MQLPLADARAVRMIQALLAAADPLERLERGAPETTYEPLATAVFEALRHGARVHDVVMLVNGYARRDPFSDSLTLGPVVAFAQAAADWWVNAEERWAPSDAGSEHSEYGKIVASRRAGH